MRQWTQINPDRLSAKAVKDAGLSIAEIARQLGVDAKTVTRWRDRQRAIPTWHAAYFRENLPGLVDDEEPGGDPRQNELTALLVLETEVDEVRAVVTGLQEQAAEQLRLLTLALEALGVEIPRVVAFPGVP